MPGNWKGKPGINTLQLSERVSPFAWMESSQFPKNEEKKSVISQNPLLENRLGTGREDQQYNFARVWQNVEGRASNQICEILRAKRKTLGGYFSIFILLNFKVVTVGSYEVPVRYLCCNPNPKFCSFWSKMAGFNPYVTPSNQRWAYWEKRQSDRRVH